MKYFATNKSKEICILIGIALSPLNQSKVKNDLEELRDLVSTAGGWVEATFIQSRKAYDSAYFTGKGKAKEIALYAEEFSIDTIIFDDELSPAQIRNWEQLSNIKVIDRSALILDIFAAHARSRESRTQVVGAGPVNLFTAPAYPPVVPSFQTGRRNRHKGARRNAIGDRSASCTDPHLSFKKRTGED
jgi:hypothetical protein